MSGFSADHAGAEVCPSPNFNVRAGERPPSIIILHYTGMKSGPGAQDWLCNLQAQVSSHYLVHEDGSIVQMVAESARAWHAGKSFWAGDTDINSASIGIEIVNPGHFLGYPDFPAPQIEAVIALCRGIIGRHGIRPERVLANSDVALGRKIDPGEKFPWATLAGQGVGHWVEPLDENLSGPAFKEGDRGLPVNAMQAMLARYGYDCPVDGEFGASTALAVTAFQRHFRPARVDGIADRSTLGTLHALLSRLLTS